MMLPRRKQNQTLKYSGKPYISADGVARQGRSMRPPCDKECRQICGQKLTEPQRQRIFDEYYSLADLHQQWQYLGQYMDKSGPKQRTRLLNERKRLRRSNVKYYLPSGTERLHVCKNMFLATFDISVHTALTVIQKTDDQGILVKKDGRGGYRLKRLKDQQHLNESSNS